MGYYHYYCYYTNRFLTYFKNYTDNNDFLMSHKTNKGGLHMIISKNIIYILTQIRTAFMDEVWHGSLGVFMDI